MKAIKTVAIDIDGVLLYDTFSPIINILVKGFGGEYTSELEKNVFSKTQKIAAEYLINYLELNISVTDMIDLYFKERANYLITHPNSPVEGIDRFLNLLKSLDLNLICYGGLPETHFKEELKDYLDYFERYICTNEFRPGIKEITLDYCNLNFNEILFIDDVNSVAEIAKKLNVPFIGIPSTNFQKNGMIETEVENIFSSIEEINSEIIHIIDIKASSFQFWK